MTPSEELAKVDAEWDALASGAVERLTADFETHDGPVSEPPGSFGHPSERRLGLRVATGCWALLGDGETSVYARTVELSATGCVLDFVDAREVHSGDEHSFTLDIFIPGATRPIHATARPARAIGRLEAFEFSEMNAADRLTLAEHLDDVVSRRPSSNPLSDRSRSAAPPAAWKHFVLSLRRRSQPIPVQRF